MVKLDLGIDKAKVKIFQDVKIYNLNSEHGTYVYTENICRHNAFSYDNNHGINFCFEDTYIAKTYSGLSGTPG